MTDLFGRISELLGAKGNPSSSSPREAIVVGAQVPPVLPLTPAPRRTPLNPMQERIFRLWYGDWAAKAGLDPNPDSPEQMYDYRGAFLAGQQPAVDAGDGLYHWPSSYKDDDHPNRFVKGVGDSRAVDRSGSVPAASVANSPQVPRAVRREFPSPVMPDATRAGGMK